MFSWIAWELYQETIVEQEVQTDVQAKDITQLESLISSLRQDNKDMVDRLTILNSKLKENSSLIP